MKRILTVFLLVGCAAAAEPKQWFGGSAAWGDPNAWTPPGVPQAGEEVQIGGGSVALGGVVSLDHRLVWTGGTLHSGTLQVEAGGSVIVSALGEKNLFQCVVVNAGSWRIDATKLGCLFTGYSQAVTISNLVGGSFELAGEAELVQVNPGGWPPAGLALVNEGTLRKTGVGVSRLAMIPLSNRGLVEVQDGLLQWSGGGASSGRFQVASGGSVTLETGTFDFSGAQWEGPGPVRVQGSLTLNGKFSAMDFGLVAGDVSGAFEVGGGFEWTGGRLVNAQVRLGSGRHRFSGAGDKEMLVSTLANAGELEWTGAAVGLRFTGYNQGITITNEPAGTFVFRDGAVLEQRNPSGWPPTMLALVNDGTLRAQGEATNAILDVPLHNRGLIDVAQGTFHHRGGGDSTGRWAVAAGAAAEWLGGTYNFDHAVQRGPGPIRLLGTHTMGGSFDAANLVFGGGSLAGEVEVSGGFHWLRGQLTGVLRLGPGDHRLQGDGGQSMLNATLANAGRLELSGAVLSVDFSAYSQAATITNQAGGEMILAGGSRIQQRNPSGWPPAALSLGNAGTLVSEGTATNGIDFVPLNNSGLLRVSDGVLQHQGGGQSSGGFEIGPAGRFEMSGGTYNLDGSQWSGAGPARVVGASTLLGTFSAANFGLEAGDLGGDFNVANGSFTWLGGRLINARARFGTGTHYVGSDADKTLLNAMLANAGHLVVDACAVGLSFSGYSQQVVLTNEPGGILELRNSARLEQRNPGGWPPVALSIQNDGILRGAGSGTNSIVAIPLWNRGVVETLAGVLQHTGGGTSPGEFKVAADAAFEFSGGTFEFESSRWRGPGSASVVGDATVNGRFQADRFVLAGGDLAGTSEISGGFHWTGGRLASAALRLGEGGHSITGAAEKALLNSSLENEGRLVFDQAVVGLLFTGYSQRAVISNLAAGTIDLVGESRIEQRNPSGWPPSGIGFANDGYVRKLGGGTAVVQSVPVTSNGRWDLESGAVVVSDGFSLGALSALTLAVADQPALQVGGQAVLNGTVQARTLAGTVPTVGAEYRVLQAGSIQGAFANSIALNPGHIFQYAVSYPPQGIGFTAESNLTEPVQLASSAVVDGAFQLQSTAPAGFTQLIESSADLVHWTLELSTNVAQGTLIWSGPPVRVDPRRFYRVGLLP